MSTSTSPAKSMADTAAEFGLKPEEYAVVLDRLGREPNLVELGVFSVMGSEHCSYKSSKNQLKKFPITGPRVICGPGENAGVIDIDDGDAIIFKMESHNHPSHIEPYQGAATGVGGIMRDVFTMGARPIALLNALRFGEPDHPKTKRLVDGVVAGIAGYGNCGRRAHGRGRDHLPQGLQRQHPGQRHGVGLADADKIFTRPRPGRRLWPWSIPAPRPAATASMARPCRRPSSPEDLEEKRPNGAGRRSLRRKAADRGDAGVDGHRAPSPPSRTWARGPDLLVGRDGRQGRGRHRA